MPITPTHCQIGQVGTLNISSLAIHDGGATLVSPWMDDRDATPPVDRWMTNTITPTSTKNTSINKNQKKKKRRVKKKKKSSNSISDNCKRKNTSTFGIGDRTISLAPYRDVDLHINLLHDRTIQHAMTTNSNPSRMFLSTSPRFAQNRNDASESGQEKRLRIVHEHIADGKKRIANRINNESKSAPLRSTEARNALVDGVAILEASLLAFEKIDQECAALLVEEKAVWGKNNQRSCGNSRPGRRPISSSNGRRNPRTTTFGVGIQRSDSLYNTVMPNCWTNPPLRGSLKDSILISSFKVKRPDRPSTFMSQSPRSCNTTEIVRTSSGGPKVERIVPTVIQLSQRAQHAVKTAYPALNKQENMWRQHELNEVLLKQQRRQQPVPTTKHLTHNITDTDNVSTTGTTSTAAATTKMMGNRPSSAGGATRKSAKKYKGKKLKRPMSAVARRIKLAKTKAKFTKSHKQIYLFDDWMQKYVLPRTRK